MEASVRVATVGGLPLDDDGPDRDGRRGPDGETA